jgi:hypothetical protein
MAERNTIAIEPRYEEQFTAFVDFLGFKEASTDLDEPTRLAVLGLLQGLASLRSEFSADTIDLPTGGKSHNIFPAVSTFSDNLLISFPLQSVLSQVGGERMAMLTILHQFNRLLSMIAAAALGFGFLIRGGATIGKLYHANGVIFGEGITEAVQLETRTAIYPRVVLSNKITRRQGWTTDRLFVVKDDDGIYHLDYISSMLFRAAPPGDDWNRNVKSWFDGVVPIIGRNLRDLELKGKLNELAKWTWFAKRFRVSLERLGPEALNAVGISLGTITWS